MFSKNRILMMVMLLALGLCTFVGCGKESRKENVKYSIVCTTFPQYDWVMQVLGDEKDNYSVTLLLDNGVDLHSYQPTAEDIATIAACDVFIYVGGESDAWVEDALKETTNEDMQVINLVDALGERVKEETIVEGMEHDHASTPENQEEEHMHVEEEQEEEHIHVEEEQEEEHLHAEEEEEHEHGIDEHIWLSLKNAQVLVERITEAIANIDNDNKSTYQENCDVYLQKLAELDEQYEIVVDEAANKTLLFGDRFPFLYMAEDYELDYYAAFTGCSAETEASFETIVFLAKKVDELGLQTIFVIESSDQKLAQAIVSNTKDKNQQILVLDSLQSVTREDIDKGATYLVMMQSNLEVIKEGLK